MDGVARRIGAHKTYVHTSRKRRQVGQDYLRKNYTLMGFCKEMFEAYWEKENVEIAYLFSDYIIALGYEKIEEIHQDVDALPENNKDCFFFIENGNKECDSAKLKRILSENWLAQLTYKVKWEKVKDGKETYFGALLKALESVEYK